MILIQLFSAAWLLMLLGLFLTNLYIGGYIICRIIYQGILHFNRKGDEQ